MRFIYSIGENLSFEIGCQLGKVSRIEMGERWPLLGSHLAWPCAGSVHSAIVCVSVPPVWKTPFPWGWHKFWWLFLPDKAKVSDQFPKWVSQQTKATEGENSLVSLCLRLPLSLRLPSAYLVTFSAVCRESQLWICLLSSVSAFCSPVIHFEECIVITSKFTFILSMMKSWRFI